MLNLNDYIIEKLHLDSNTKVAQPEIGVAKWITCIKEAGGKISSYNMKFYTITLKEYSSDESPELTIYIEKGPKPKYWRACYPQEPRTYYTNDIKIITTKNGNDNEYYIDKDSLDRCEYGWTFTKHNAEEIINKLKEFDNE